MFCHLTCMLDFQLANGYRATKKGDVLPKLQTPRLNASLKGFGWRVSEEKIRPSADIADKVWEDLDGFGWILDGFGIFPIFRAENNFIRAGWNWFPLNLIHPFCWLDKNSRPSLILFRPVIENLRR